MKPIFIISLICYFGLCLSLSTKSFMKELGDIEKPVYMEKVISSNPTSVKATMKIIEPKVPEAPEKKKEVNFGADSQFKQINPMNQLDMSKMVAPEIKRVNSLSQNNPFTVSSIIAKDEIPSNLVKNVFASVCWLENNLT